VFPSHDPGGRQFYGSANPFKQLKEIHEQSTFMRERALNFNQNVRHIRQRIDKPGARVAVEDTYFAPMLIMQTAIDGPTWAGAYAKATAAELDGGLGLDHEAAVDFADQIVRDSQGSGLVSDLAAAQRKGGLASLFTRFYNYMNTTLQLNLEVIRREKTGVADYAAAMHDLAMTNVVPSILMVALSQALVGSEDDDESFVEEVVRELGSMLAGQFLLLREFSGMFKGFEYNGPAGLRGFAHIGRAAGRAADGDIDEKFWKEAINVIGFLVGAPSTQVNRTIDGARALLDGDTDRPTALLFGPPR
jgi:hypothetical protein